MIEVLKKMVEALEWCHGGEPVGTAEAIKAGKKAIAELESQEPFCYAYKENGEDFFAPKDGYYPADAKPLYTHPPQRTWVGLEGEEIRNLWEEVTKPDRSTMTMVTSFARAIESKLKQKNGFAEEKNT